jgi:hypothetical protein
MTSRVTDLGQRGAELEGARVGVDLVAASTWSRWRPGGDRGGGPVAARAAAVATSERAAWASQAVMFLRAGLLDFQ